MRQARHRIGVAPRSRGFSLFGQEALVRGGASIDLLNQAVAWFDPETIVGSNPVTEWRSRGNLGHDFDLDVPVGTTANLITLESGVAYVNGVAGSIITTPDSAVLDVTGDIDIRIRAALTNWGAFTQGLVDKFGNVGQRAYQLRMHSSVPNRLQFLWSEDGSTAITKASDVVIPFANGTVGWFKVTMDVDNDAGDAEIKFYTSPENVLDSDDVVTWTQLGSTQLVGATTFIQPTTQVLTIMGSIDGGTSTEGKVYRAQIYNGIDGTLVADYDSRKFAVNASTAQMDTGEIFTLEGDAFVNATNYTGIYSRGSVGLETTAGQLINSPVTVFIVLKPTFASPGSDQRLLDARSISAAAMQLITLNSAADKYTMIQGIGITLSQGFDNNLRVITCQFNGNATAKLTVSDVGSVTGNAGAENWDFSSLGMATGGTLTFTGLYLEYLVFNTALSEEDITLVQDHLQDKYS